MPETFVGEAADLDAMLEDSPHTVTIGVLTRPCFFDSRAEVDTLTGSAAPQVQQIEIATVKADAFPGLAEGQAATIAEYLVVQRTYVIVRILRSGPMAELWLQRS